MIMARRELLYAIPALAAALALGCGGVPEKRFYALANEPEPAGPGGGPACARTAVVAPLEIAVPYDDDRIVFRTGGHEVKYFSYDFWVGRPQEMFQQLLAQKIERARLFAAVDPQLSSARTHLTVFATIDAIELVATGELIEARLAMTLRLRDDEATRTVWEHAFDTRRPVANQGRAVNVEETVRTLNGIYAAEVAAAVVRLRALLPAYAGCAAAE
jgi:ABC-type uncharacterized transport system auxiliary subunit